jgi:hypothetical protein
LGILLLLLLLVQMLLWLLLVVLQVLLLLLLVVGVMVQLCVLHLWARHNPTAAVMLHCWVDSATTGSASSSSSSSSSGGGGCCCCCCRLSFHCCRKLWQHLLQHLILLCVSRHCRVLVATGDTKLRAKAVAAAAWRRLLLLMMMFVL